MKKKLVLKPFVLPTIYILMVIVLMCMSSIMLYDKKEDDKIDYVADILIDDTVPVLSKEETYIIKPFTSDKVKITTNFYNYLGEESIQENSIVKYDNTYLQNSGITYSSSESFEVVSIMDGMVTKVYENDILGNIIEITHDKNIISVYQMLTDVKVKVNQRIKKGEVIATSGKSLLSLEEHNLHLELIKDGITINPQDYIGKNIKEI